MCHLLTVSFPPDIALPYLREVLAFNGQQLELFTHSPVLAGFPKGTHYGTLTTGHCNCGTSIGGYEPPSTKALISAAKINKLKKRGWNSKRIQNWLNAKQEVEEKITKGNAIKALQELKKWHELITNVLVTSKVKSFGLMKHNYSGQYDSESFCFTIVALPLRQLSHEMLSHLPEDVLHEFSRKR
jgi:hypothetical protein